MTAKRRETPKGEIAVRIEAAQALSRKAMGHTLTERERRLLKSRSTEPTTKGKPPELSTTSEFLVGTAAGNAIKFVEEVESGGIGAVTLTLDPKDWDVTDADARDEAGREQLGSDDYEWHRNHLSAQWWINPDSNSAVLAVYRPRRV